MLAAWKDLIAMSVSDRASRLVAFLGLFITAGLCLLGFYLIRDLRDSAWLQAEVGAKNLLSVIEQSVRRNVEMYDLSLRAVADEALNPAFRDMDPGTRRLLLFDRSSTATGFGTILVIDQSGRIVFSSNEKTPLTPAFADMPEFLEHKNNPALDLVMAGPHASRISGTQVLSMSRRLSSADRSFVGIVSGAIKLDYLQTLFAGLSIAPGSAITLFLGDGTVLARSPYVADFIGRNIASGEPYRGFQKAQRGVVVSTSALDGVERLYAFSHIQGFPLIVNVAVSVDSISAGWRPKAFLIGWLVGALVLVALGLTVLLQREILRRSEAQASSLTANAELATLAHTDALTGLPNRRRYDKVLAAEWRRAARTGSSLSLLILDTDNFKRFNDHFGHHTGDEVLKAIAVCLRDILDPHEAIGCRIGGEEFAVILAGGSEGDAKVLAERIRRAIVGLQIPHAPEIGGVATISIGVAHAQPSADLDPDLLFAEADAALYEAKRSGRNRVRVHPTTRPPAPTAMSA